MSSIDWNVLFPDSLLSKPSCRQKRISPLLVVSADSDKNLESIWNLLYKYSEEGFKIYMFLYTPPRSLPSTSTPKPQNVSNWDINSASPRRGWMKPKALPQPPSVGCPVLSKEHCAPWLASAISEKGTEMRSKDPRSLWKEPLSFHYRPQERSSPFKDGG